MCRGSQTILYCGCSAALAKNPQLTASRACRLEHSSTILAHGVARVLRAKSKVVGELQLKGHAGHNQGMQHQKAQLLNSLAVKKDRTTIFASRLDSLLMYTTGTEAPSDANKMTASNSVAPRKSLTADALHS